MLKRSDCVPLDFVFALYLLDEITWRFSWWLNVDPCTHATPQHIVLPKQGSLTFIISREDFWVVFVSF